MTCWRGPPSQRQTATTNPKRHERIRLFVCGCGKLPTQHPGPPILTHSVALFHHRHLGLSVRNGTRTAVSNHPQKGYLKKRCSSPLKKNKRRAWRTFSRGQKRTPCCDAPGHPGPGAASHPRRRRPQRPIGGTPKAKSKMAGFYCGLAMIQ